MHGPAPLPTPTPAPGWLWLPSLPCLASNRLRTNSPREGPSHVPLRSLGCDAAGSTKSSSVTETAAGLLLPRWPYLWFSLPALLPSSPGPEEERAGLLRPAW